MSLPESGHEQTCKAIGADAGGTKLALAFSDGSQTLYHQAPSANLRADSPESFANRLATGIREGLDGMPLDEDVTLCVGAAGAGTRSSATACRTHLAVALGVPESRIMVTSDARVALQAAFDGKAGLLIIAGTGSGCYGLDDSGTMHRAGGWGPGLEDPGSGNELGRSAIKHLLSDLEGRNLSAFSLRIATAMGIDGVSIEDVLDTFYRSGFNPSFLAPLILDLFEANDPVAVDLVHRQCAALSRQCARLAKKLSQTPLDPIAVMGGLTSRDSYFEALTDALKMHLSGAKCTRLTRPPVEGALAWAESMSAFPETKG